jgi:ribosomal protein L9
MAENIRQRAHKEAKMKEEALKLAEKIQAIDHYHWCKNQLPPAKFLVRSTTFSWPKQLLPKGIEIDRRHIIIPKDGVKEIGKHTAKIKLHREVVYRLRFRSCFRICITCSVCPTMSVASIFPLDGLIGTCPETYKVPLISTA